MSRLIRTQQRVISPQLQTWAHSLVRRIGAKVPPAVSSRRRRLLIVHLDGVPKALLEEAVQRGTMPFFSRLVRSGAYHMDDAFWGSPASTPFFQAGFLYGLEHPNLPAYSWFDRELGRKVRMNAPQDALDIEARLGRDSRDSLLAGGGHTYFSLFHAGALNRLCMSTLASLKVMARSLSYEMQGIVVARTTEPFAYLRSLGVDAWLAAREAYRWVRAVRDWRHESAFLFSRVVLQRLGWSFAHTKALVDLVRGVPAIYLVFGNFDEVAHRRGPRSAQARAELRRVDAYLAELYAVAHSVEHPYDVLFLTDHGHVDSLPFEQRQGRKLEDVLLSGPPAPLPEPLRRGLLDGRPEPRRPAPRDAPAPVVIEAGNFAHVYLTREHAPLEAADLVARHPEVMARAVGNPDVALVAVRRRNEAVALVKGGVYGANDVERAPLSSEFSRRALKHYLLELPHMKTAGDLVLFGEAVREGGTVGFAWEFGSHGGLTTMETRSMVCWPSDAPLDLSGLGHCSRLHERLSEVYRG
ncbi:alkaline phosphatase family protein [Myxococcaceae bacterium GXIMD 01537]